VEPSDFDLLAASLRADARDLDTFVEALATKLEASLGGHAKVERKRGGLGSAKRVHRIAADLGDEQFELESDGGAVHTRKRKMVRGIALRTDELDLDDWITALSRALVVEAESTERGRAALEQLLR
jgi:hypothetical protein